MFCGPGTRWKWLAKCRVARETPSLDVVLITHPRDNADVSRLFPWADSLNADEMKDLGLLLKPILGEVVKTDSLTIGTVFLPCVARDLMNPRTRKECRTMLDEALVLTAEFGRPVVCLGGLTGSLTRYGRSVEPRAFNLGLTLTSGHSLTSISVFETFCKALSALEMDLSGSSVAVVGTGSIGSAFVRLLSHHNPRPAVLHIVELTSRLDRAERLACEVGDAFARVRLETTNPAEPLGDASSAYRSDVVVSAVSTPYVLDVSRVRPRTLLVDDSQPYCWSREDAWRRVSHSCDIAPCEAGLIDASALGYQAHFPFDFADHTEQGTSTVWCCLAEGLLKSLHPDLPVTIGEPCLDGINAYKAAYDSHGLGTATLQCGPNLLPVEDLVTAFRC